LVTAVSGRPKPEICLLPGRFWVNTLAQGVLRQFTQWPWKEHPTFQLRGGHFTTELVPKWVTSMLISTWPFSIQILSCYHLILLKGIAVGCRSSKKIDMRNFLKKKRSSER